MVVRSRRIRLQQIAEMNFRAMAANPSIFRSLILRKSSNQGEKSKPSFKNLFIVRPGSAFRYMDAISSTRRDCVHISEGAARSNYKQIFETRFALLALVAAFSEDK